MSNTKIEEKSSGSQFWAVVWGVFILFLLTILLVKFFVFQQVTVVGSSMVPNYRDGQLLLVNQLDKTFNRGQVVAVFADKEVAKSASESDIVGNYMTRFSAKFFLKRIVGLPGEEIEIIDSKVIIYNTIVTYVQRDESERNNQD